MPSDADAQLSDIHVANLTPAAHIRAAIASANAAKPDLIALTGDYVCWRRHEVALAAAQLGGLSAPRVWLCSATMTTWRGAPA